MTDFLIQPFRIVVSWILLHRIWNCRLYTSWITKSFDQNNTVKMNTLNIKWLQKNFYKEYCYLFKHDLNTGDGEEATFLILPLVFPSRLIICSRLWLTAVWRGKRSLALLSLECLSVQDKKCRFAIIPQHSRHNILHSCPYWN